VKWESFVDAVQWILTFNLTSIRTDSSQKLIKDKNSNSVIEAWDFRALTLSGVRNESQKKDARDVRVALDCVVRCDS
jgi:hypothetical protein